MLKIVGAITAYKGVKYASRLMVGYGAGKSKVVAHVQFLDHDTGAVILEQDVTGNDVSEGRGETVSAFSNLATEVAKLARRSF